MSKVCTRDAVHFGVAAGAIEREEKCSADVPFVSAVVSTFRPEKASTTDESSSDPRVLFSVVVFVVFRSSCVEASVGHVHSLPVSACSLNFGVTLQRCDDPGFGGWLDGTRNLQRSIVRCGRRNSAAMQIRRQPLTKNVVSIRNQTSHSTHHTDRSPP